MKKNTRQLWLDFGEIDEKPRRRRLSEADYLEIAIAIGERDVTLEELKKIAGPGVAINHVIDYLSINYTLYDVCRGVYAMARPVKRKR